MTHCQGCGAESAADGPQPSHCPNCPPDICVDCGGVNDYANHISCSCWVSLEGMAHADIKALFAADGTFSLGIPTQDCAADE